MAYEEVNLTPKGVLMDLGILNTIIALVVVLLVLSLLVQAIQTLLKKILKLKSRQIEGSLKDLYEQVVGAPNPKPQPSAPALIRHLGRTEKILGMKINCPRPPPTSSKTKFWISSRTSAANSLWKRSTRLALERAIFSK